MSPPCARASSRASASPDAGAGRAGRGAAAAEAIKDGLALRRGNARPVVLDGYDGPGALDVRRHAQAAGMPVAGRSPVLPRIRDEIREDPPAGRRIGERENRPVRQDDVERDALPRREDRVRRRRVRGSPGEVHGRDRKATTSGCKRGEVEHVLDEMAEARPLGAHDIA